MDAEGVLNGSKAPRPNSLTGDELLETKRLVDEPGGNRWLPNYREFSGVIGSFRLADIGPALLVYGKCIREEFIIFALMADSSTRFGIATR